MFVKPIEAIGDYNPQLLRELKGKLTKGKVILAVSLSVVAQVLFCWTFTNQLDYLDKTHSPLYSRYCTGTDSTAYDGYGFECIKNLLGQVDIRWELWWFDLFFSLSIASVFILLLGGTYLLAMDLIQEDKKGTLDFIRLSPITAKDFFIGKIIGVPSLLYLVIGLTLPLHFWAGLQSHISPDLILAFYLLLGTSCVFFYSMALLFAFITRRFCIPSAIATSSIVAIFLVVTTFSILLDMDTKLHPDTGLIMLNPGIFLSHLAKATLIPSATSGYFTGKHNLTDTLWYGQAIWSDAWGMIVTVFLNYVWWIYIAFQGLKRIYHSPTATLFSKLDSYWISVGFVLIWLGFVKQNTSNDNNLINLFFFQFCLGVLFFILIGSISPHRQTLLDWSRYSHHNYKSLLRDLVVGEKSPSIVAMMVNSLLVFSYLVIPFYMVFYSEDRLSGILGLICQLTTLCLLTLIAQFILMLPVKQMGVVALVSISMSSFFGLLAMAILKKNTGFSMVISPFALPSFMVINWPSFVLTLAFESLVFIGLGLAMHKQLSRFGESETKALLK